MSKLETIELELHESEGYAILYLNRPNQLNALNFQLASDFCSAITEVSKKEAIRCLIVTGKGKAFCAGGDLVEFQKAKDTTTFIANLAKKFHEGITLLKSLNAPSIAAVNGSCFGVGLSLACACDLRACSEDAKFAVAFTSVGLSPDSSLTFHLPKIVGLSVANEMAILNRVLDANEAKQCNLVSQIIFPKESFLEEVKKLAKKIGQGPTLAFGSTKELLIKSYYNDLDTHLEEELEHVKKNAGREDFKEGIKSFFEKRKRIFKGK